ncbi:hypothetical protein SYJ56_19665 [Algoriphagus sp. D3-2-R+10]|uniref:hypothetical protein n=1 Tax=Algoriphagus aurantiacus TaxID=3103948 RepID=UPI002B3A7F3B|nr:hypothetical protein [Algoriphagus sp. D3-2-R+10]MEB2777543.1 hypothetical protein [Algoriphagus sp. D3-2-R+10]
MERLKSNAFLLLWIILGVGAMITVWFLPWKFQVNDDVIMMWLVSGAYTGEPESYAVFIHPFLSWGFSILYTYFPNFNWYGATWFIAIFYGYLLMLYKVSTTSFSRSWQSLFALLILIIALHFSYFLQFTLVAGFLALAGLLVFFSGSNEKSKYVIYGGALAIVFSFLIREEALFLVGIGYFLSELVIKGLRPLVQHSSKLLIILMMILALFLSRTVIENQDVYRDYSEFNKARSSVKDHPVFYQLERNSQINTSDKWFYFSRWMFEEGEISIADLEEKKRELDQNFFSLEYFTGSFKRLWEILKMEMFKSMLILLLTFLTLVTGRKSKKTLRFVVIWLLFLLLFNYFFLIFGRVIMLFFLVSLGLILNHGRVSGKNILAKGITVCILAFFSFHTINFLKEASGRKIMNRELASIFEKVPEGTPIFMERFYENNFIESFNWKNPVPILSYGWISRSPFQQKAFHRFGFNSLSELEEFSFIGVNIPEPLVFPNYIESLAGDFEVEIIDVSPNFTFKRYTKSWRNHKKAYSAND